MFPAHNTLTQFEREEREACVRYYVESLHEAVTKSSDYRRSGDIAEDALNVTVVKLLRILRDPVKLQKIRENGGDENIIKFSRRVWENARNDEWNKQQELQGCPFDGNADYKEAKALGICTEYDLRENIEASWESILPVSEEILLWMKQRPDVLWTIVALTLTHLTEEQRPVWILRKLEGWGHAKIAGELYLDERKEYLARKHYQRAKERFKANVMQYVKVYYGETIRSLD